MKSRAFSRFSMLTAGIVAVVIVLFSMFYQSTVELNKSKVETNKSKSSTEQPASDYLVVNAPSDALPGSATVQVEAKTLPLLETFLPIEKVQESVCLTISIPVRYLKTLLKTVISPNAP